MDVPSNEERPVETSLYYITSRYYDPEIGRFISPDSVDYLNLTSINGLNLYAYCNNDPVNLCDPSGHMPEWAKWVLGGLTVSGLVVATILICGAAGAGAAAIGSFAGPFGTVIGLVVGTGISIFIDWKVGSVISDLIDSIAK